MPEQIYNADGTGLILLMRTLEFLTEIRVPGYKKSKERITLGCCSNAVGDHIWKLVVIGKSKKTRPFKVSKADILPFYYYGQKCAWMDQEIFSKVV